MIKAFLLIISILTAFKEFYVTGQFCDHEGFYVGYKINTLCNGEKYNTVNFMVEKCCGKTGQCKTVVPDQTRIRNEYTGVAGPFKGSPSHLTLNIEHMCGHCPDSTVKLPLPEDAIRCKDESDAHYNFGDVELSDFC